MKSYIILLIIFFLGVSQYKLDIKESNLTINGTSTLHDWTSVVEKFDVESDLMFNSDELVLSKFVLIAQVKSIKSGKESMDENTYESMNADDYPTINFELTKIKNMDKDSVYSLMTMGKLTINNVTKEIPINVKIKKLGSKASIEGSKTFKMTDYGIDPPSMFLGTINTGNEITIKFNLKLTSNKEE